MMIYITCKRLGCVHYGVGKICQIMGHCIHGDCRDACAGMLWRLGIYCDHVPGCNDNCVIFQHLIS